MKTTKTGLLVVFIISIICFTSCSKDNSNELVLEKGQYKIEIINSENCKFYKEVIVLQVSDENAKNVTISNTEEFEVVFDVVAAKTLSHTHGAKSKSTYTTSKPISTITLSLGFMLDSDYDLDDAPSFSCIINAYMDDKLIDTSTYTINDNPVPESITNVYSNGKKLVY